MMITRTSERWTVGWRLLIFILASTSLGCLLAQFYNVCSMGRFATVIFLPATIALAVLASFDLRKGSGQLGRAVVIGATAGFIAALSYDIFRLPFVYAREWGIAAIVPPLNLFKVFPAFGAMLLGQPIQQPAYSLGTVWLGWAYHFSNGITIGIMYLALIGDARTRHWGWAVLVAVVLELGMLLTPYPKMFNIPVTARFVVVTLAAHGVFGVCLGLTAKSLARSRQLVNRH
jgi:hypothetical protein